MQKGKVSIVIPCYNREVLIKSTLQSVLEQEYENWECFIVDDHSTDDTRNIIEQYIATDSRFELIYNVEKSKGAPSSRNLGLKHITGEFVIFLDSDDILFPHSIKERVKHLNSCNSDFCVSDCIKGYYPINNKNEYRIVSIDKSKNNTLDSFLDFIPQWVVHCATYRACFLNDNCIKWSEDLKCYQDIDFHLQVVLKTDNYSYINSKPDCLWRIHDNDNIGSLLKTENVLFEQRFKILNNLINNDPINLAGNKNRFIGSIINYYLFNSQTNKPLKDVLNLYFKITKKRVLIYYLYQLYYLLIRNKVRFLTSITRRLLIMSGEKDILVPQKVQNVYFLTKEYRISD